MATATAAPSDSDAATDAPTAVGIDRVADATLEVAGGPDFPIAAFESLWLLAPDSDDPALVRVDPQTNEEVARILLPGRLCQGLVASDDAIWFCTADGAGWVDPATNEIAGLLTYPAASATTFLPRIGRMAFGSGSVWGLSGDVASPEALMRIDPSTLEATLIPLGHAPGTIAYGFGAVWVTAPDDGLLLRVDPTDNEVSEHAAGLADPWTVVAGPDSLWITLHGSEDSRPAVDDPTLARVDSSDGTVIAEIATGAGSGTYGGLWADGDAVWVRTPDRAAFLVRIDAETNLVVATFEGPGSSGDVIVAFGSVWATAVEFNDVYRLEP